MTLRSFLAARILVLVLSGLITGQAVAARSAEPRVVKDPHYGEVLFYFYQQQYFTALSRLMTAQHFNQFQHHADEAELLRGGMLLSYGVHLEAGRIFERLIAQGAAPDVRNRAWFYLAKIRYQRGYVQEAEQALAQIEGKLPAELDEERQILHALVLMQRGEYRGAADLLKNVAGNSPWSRYGRYNLGVALVRAGETQPGIALLDQLGREPAQDEEMASLRDKVNVALGFSLLQADRADEAKASLERVRLSGLMTNKALLGMGWAQLSLNRTERALVYWEELRQRGILDSAVQESMLAVPFALGKLGAYRQSLERYEEASRLYEQEMSKIDQSVAAIRAGKLSELLLRDDTSEEDGWFWKLEKLPDAPEARYLVQLMAGHDFQEALKNYRDLRFLIARLDQWAHDLPVYEDMLATRRAGFRERLPQSLTAARERDSAAHKEARDRLRDTLARIILDDDAEALANEREHDQGLRLARLERLLERQGSATDPDTVERVRLLRGLLTWDQAVAFPAHRWEAQHSLQELDKVLDDTRSWREALSQARETMPREFDAFEARIQALTPRLRALQARAHDLAVAQSAYLGELAVVELTAQRERLATYLTQVHFAVAQIYDQSASETKEAPAP
jgi:hypothetical protein